MQAEIIPFPPQLPPPRLTKLAECLYMMQLSDTPEAQAAADKLVAQLRANNYIVPDSLKG